MTPQDFSRAFAAAFGAQDADGLATHLSENIGMLTLTGAWTEGREAARAGLAADFAGVFARARLVTGKRDLRAITPGITLLHQRFVVSGAQAPDGADLPRFGAMLIVVLVADGERWLAESLTFSGLAE